MSEELWGWNREVTTNGETPVADLIRHRVDDLKARSLPWSQIRYELEDGVILSGELLRSMHYGHIGFFLDVRKRRVVINGVPTKLSPQEMRIMHILGMKVGRFVPVEDIEEEIWGHLSPQNRRCLRVVIGHIRGKIGRKCITMKIGAYAFTPGAPSGLLPEAPSHLGLPEPITDVALIAPAP